MNDSFLEGEDYILLQRRSIGFVEVLTKDGYAKDFIMEHMIENYYYRLGEYFNLVPVNERMVLIEKINNTYEFKNE